MSHLSKSCHESPSVVSKSEEEEDGDSLAAMFIGRSSKTDSASEIAPLGRSCESSYHQSLRIRGVTLHYCTEGLGSESSDDQDENTASWDLQAESIPYRRLHGEESGTKIEENAEWRAFDNEVRSSDHSAAPVNAGHEERFGSVDEEKLVQTPKYNGKFPPPISSIARGASPHRPLDSQSTFLRSYKRDGRFLLQEVKVPCQNFLRASRKDGRLTLQLYNYSDSPNLEKESARRELDLCSHEKMEISQPTKIESRVDLERFAGNELESNHPGVNMAGRISMEESVSDVSDVDEGHVTPACSTDGTSSTGRVVQNVMAVRSRREIERLEESSRESGAGKEGSCEARETEIRELNCMSSQIRVMEKQDRYPCFSQTYDTPKLSSIEQRSFREYYDSSMIPAPAVAVC